MGHALKKLTLSEFLVWDDTQAERHEFIDGEIFSMVGGSLNHARVVRELASRIHTHLRNTPCEVFSESTKITVASAVFYPDVFVTCQRTQPGASTVADAPMLIVEVLSPHTRAMDYDTKLTLYRRLPELAQYVLVDPMSRTVESFSRTAADAWALVDHTPGGVLPLAPIDLHIALADLFAALD